MTDRVSDERIAELLGPELSVIKYAEVYLLAAEVRAARERETRREYAVARPASMPDMTGRERWTLIVGSTFPSLGRAEEARQRVPSLRDRDAVIVSRIAPGSDWEAVTGDDWFDA